MNNTVLWIGFGCFVSFYLLSELTGKEKYIKCKDAFIVETRNNWTGKIAAEKYFSDNNVCVDIKEKRGAFDDRYINRKNTLFVSDTGVKSKTVASLNSVLREAVRGEIYSKNKIFFTLILYVLNILKTFTLLAVPLFFVSLIFKNDYLTAACIASYFVLGIYNLLITPIEISISKRTEIFVKEKGMLDKKGMYMFNMLNEIANYSLIYSTFTSIRQVGTILMLMFQPVKK